MTVHHLNRAMSLGELRRLVSQMATQAVENAAFGSAGLRVYGGGWIVIENGGLSVTGTANISGSANVTGSLNVSGTLNGSGTLDWTGMTRLRGPIMVTGNMTGSGDLLWSGPWELRGAGTISGNTRGTGQLTWVGPWNMQGNGRIEGNTAVSGNMDITGRLGVDGTAYLRSTVYVDDALIVRDGYLQAGTVRIDRNGSYGGRVVSTGATLGLDAAQTIWLSAPSTYMLHSRATSAEVVGLLEAGRLDVAGAKNFKIRHPTKADHFLRHGSTESPVSGTEYWGEAALDQQGEAVVELPEYFEELNRAENRAVQVTAIGRPFITGYDRILDGTFVVYGEPGREVSWLVKAQRRAEHGGSFDLEEPIIGPQRKPV